VAGVVLDLKMAVLQVQVEQVAEGLELELAELAILAVVAAVKMAPPLLVVALVVLELLLFVIGFNNMAHFAKIDLLTNIIIEINVVDNEDIQDLPFPESEPVGIQFLLPWSVEETYWKQTSYNSKFRKNYAVIGGVYDSVRDAFIPIKPYPSWTLNENTCIYEAPLPRPIDDNVYTWSEEQLNWVKND
jgi:hypothetical protein